MSRGLQLVRNARLTDSSYLSPVFGSGSALPDCCYLETTPSVGSQGDTGGCGLYLACPGRLPMGSTASALSL